MNRRLADKLDWIKLAVALPMGLIAGALFWRYYPPQRPHVESCPAPSCVIVTLPDCDATATRYRGRDAVRVRCKP